jgi:hypothetical protein
MSFRSDDEDWDFQFQEKSKLTLQYIEENSVDQLIAQPSPAFKETLKKMLTANNEEIVRLGKLNIKILECLERFDEQDQEKAQQNSSKVIFFFVNS